MLPLLALRDDNGSGIFAMRGTDVMQESLFTTVHLEMPGFCQLQYQRKTWRQGI
jgi:hypothetical protein